MSTHVPCRHVRTCPDHVSPSLRIVPRDETSKDMWPQSATILDDKVTKSDFEFDIELTSHLFSSFSLSWFIPNLRCPWPPSHLRRHDVGSAASGRPRAPKATQDEPTEQSLSTRENMTKYDTLDLTWLNILSFWRKVWLPQSLIPSMERTSAHYGFRVTFSGSLACIFGGVLERLSTVS